MNQYRYFYNIQNYQETVELIKIQAQQKRVDIKVNLLIQKFDIYSDPNRLKQIILNLLSNSLKFTEDGKIEITVEGFDENSSNNNPNIQTNLQTNIKKFSETGMKSRSLQNLFKKQTSFKSIQNLRKTYLNQNDKRSFSILKITIADTGGGMSESVQKNLFKMYATFDNQKKQNQMGTGLGLMICKKLVSMLGPSDSIKVTSQIGKGSEFSFLIFTTLQEQISPTHKHRTPKDQKYLLSLKAEESISINNSPSQKSVSVNMQNVKNKKKIILKNEKYICSSQVLMFSKCNSARKILRRTDSIEKFDAEDYDNSKNQNVLFSSKLTNLFFEKKQDKSRRLSDEKCLNEIEQLNGELNELQLQFEIENPSNMIDKIFSKKTSILVVDDEVFNIIAFKLMLEKHTQLEIEEAYNGQRAIEKFCQIKLKASINQYFEYIFLDLSMPLLDGYQTAEKIKNMVFCINKIYSLQIQDEEIREVHLIALSGYDDQGVKDLCQQKGFDAFLQKPLIKQNLIKAFIEL